jgi:putative acetyltransferase
VRRHEIAAGQRPTDNHKIQISQLHTTVPIAIESPNQPDVIALIDALDAYQHALYPLESTHTVDLASLKPPDVVCAVARNDAGQAIGCGAIIMFSDFGELKRMYVSPFGRRQGVAKKILVLLESEAMAAGCAWIKLETGPYQPEAIALYSSFGYDRCEPFGAYTNDPLSVFMQKRMPPKSRINKSQAPHDAG